MIDINWGELPDHAVCLVSHNDFSGCDLCFIDKDKGLCAFDGGEPIDFISYQLIAINPSVSLKDFGRSLHLSSYNHIKELHKIIEELKNEQQKNK